jgi:hypothetical protein
LQETLRMLIHSIKTDALFQAPLPKEVLPFEGNISLGDHDFEKPVGMVAATTLNVVLGIQGHSLR